MGSVSQVQTTVYIKILPLMPQIAIVQHGGNANIDMPLEHGHSTKEHERDDQISAKKDARLIVQTKRKYKQKKHKKKRAKMKGR